MNTKQAIKNVALVPDKYDKTGGTITGTVNINGHMKVYTDDDADLNSLNSDTNVDIRTANLDNSPGQYYNVRNFSHGNKKRNMQIGWYYGGANKLKYRIQNSNNSTWGEWGDIYSTLNKPTPSDIGALPVGSWSVSGQDLRVHSKRALVGESNGTLHLGYGGDFTSIKCGNSYTVWHSGNFDPNSKLSTSASCNKNWNWSGQSGQPQWVWGGSDGTNMYVYNPSNFSVNYAASSGNSNKIGGKTIFVQQSQPTANATGDIWISW